MSPREVRRAPAVGQPIETRHGRLELQLDAALARQVHQTIAHVTRTVRHRNSLPVSSSSARESQILFEEGSLSSQGHDRSMPRTKWAGESVTNRSGWETTAGRCTGRRR